MSAAFCEIMCKCDRIIRHLTRSPARAPCACESYAMTHTYCTPWPHYLSISRINPPSPSNIAMIGKRLGDKRVASYCAMASPANLANFPLSSPHKARRNPGSCCHNDNLSSSSNACDGWLSLNLPSSGLSRRAQTTKVPQQQV